MEKKSTISDVAKAAGVSKTTISRYLNGHYEFMSDETKSMIESIIKDLNYSPNNLARGLKSKKSRLIGIVVNTLEYQVAALFVRGIHDVCVENGYGTIICCSDNILSREIEELKMCTSQQVDGIVLIPVNQDCKLYHQIHESGTPIVMSNRFREDWKYDAVYVDNVGLSRRMLDHLIDNGYNRIALFTDNDLKESNKSLREEAFVDFINNNININGNEFLYRVKQSPETVRNSILDFINKCPNERKAIFAINTNTLFLTLCEIKKLGMKIPEDIGVCGYDLIGWTDLVYNGITSLEQPFYDLGVAAGRQIIKSVNNPSQYRHDEIVLKGTIHFRDSTKAI